MEEYLSLLSLVCAEGLNSELQSDYHSSSPCCPFSRGSPSCPMPLPSGIVSLLSLSCYLPSHLGSGHLGDVCVSWKSDYLKPVGKSQAGTEIPWAESALHQNQN